MTFGAIMKTLLFKQKLVLLLFGQLWEKLGLLFILTSGHTGRQPLLLLSISSNCVNLPIYLRAAITDDNGLSVSTWSVGRKWVIQKPFLFIKREREREREREKALGKNK